MTVFIYVNTCKQVGDADHLKVFAMSTLRKSGSRRTTRKAWRSNMRFWSEPARWRNSRTGRHVAAISTPIHKP